MHPIIDYKTIKYTAMKKLIISSIILFLTIISYSQGLLDIYKGGTVKLNPDTEFAKGNDWDQIFESYTDKMGSTHIGARKSLVIKPDGSLVVSHAYRDFYSLFDADGKFMKEFEVTNSKGGREKKLHSISDIIGGNTFIAGADNMGNMRCFDFDGKMIKTLNANYSSRQLLVLNEDKVAVVGWVIWKEKFRNFVAIIDYNTNKEKIIWDHFTDRSDCGSKPGLFSYVVKFENSGMMSLNTMPYTKHTGNNFSPRINKVGSKLIVAVPGSGEVVAFDFNGNQLSKVKVSWEAGSISVEEQKTIQRKYIEKMKERGESRFVSRNVSEKESKRIYFELLKQMEEDLKLISDPINKPYFSTILNDSDGNLLFFEFPEEKGDNKFNVWVYNNGGEYICQSSFECEEYNLAIGPGKMVFKDGYIYGLQVKKAVEGIPLRLVRYTLQ